MLCMYERFEKFYWCTEYNILYQNVSFALLYVFHKIILIVSRAWYEFQNRLQIKPPEIYGSDVLCQVCICICVYICKIYVCCMYNIANANSKFWLILLSLYTSLTVQRLLSPLDYIIIKIIIREYFLSSNDKVQLYIKYTSKTQK